MLLGFANFIYQAPPWFYNLPVLRQINIDVVNFLIWPGLQIALLVFVVLTLVAYLTLAERKISAWMQARLGPNRVGPLGLLQPLADGIKLLIKEDLIPLKADQLIFTLAPVICLAAALAVLAVIPWGPAWATIANIDIGLLFVLAVSSMGVLGIILGGWASNSKYALLGALRSSAQIISYEIAMGLALVGALVFTKTLVLQEIIQGQAATGLWNVLVQPLGFVIFLISGIAETNRAPFDLPEAESELVAGFHTEYSGFRFSVFFMAEYTNMLVVSAIAVTVFLGGWHLPLVTNWLATSASLGALYVPVGIIVFASKTAILLYLFFWLRWSLPRYRYDQLMTVGWKWLIPAALANIVLTAIWLVMAQYFGLVGYQGSYYDFRLGGSLFLIATAWLITIPISWILLGVLNPDANATNWPQARSLPAPQQHRAVSKVVAAVESPVPAVDTGSPSEQ
jgi:NADH-quinone oxidoreductase subunit H